MSMSDPIADMLTRIRNAGRAKHTSVDIPGAKVKISLAKLLKEEGYIKNYKFIQDSKQGILRIYLKYGLKDESVIFGIDRVSKPSRRVYTKNRNIVPVLNGLGIAVISTSKGLMSDKQAKKKNLGGEIICKVY